MRRRRARKGIADWPSEKDWAEQKRHEDYFKRRGYSTSYEGPIAKVDALFQAVASVSGMLAFPGDSFSVQASKVGLKRRLEDLLLAIGGVLMRIKYPSYSVVSDADREIGRLVMEGLTYPEIQKTLKSKRGHVELSAIAKAAQRIPKGAYLGSKGDIHESEPIHYAPPRRVGRPRSKNVEKKAGRSSRV